MKMAIPLKSTSLCPGAVMKKGRYSAATGCMFPSNEMAPGLWSEVV